MDQIKIKTLFVDIQENGIIRESISGTYICRVKEDAETKAIMQSSFVAPPTCTPNERAFLDEIREKGGYSDAMYIKTAHYQPHYEPGLWLGEGTCIWQKDFTKSNLKELINEQ